MSISEKLKPELALTRLTLLLDRLRKRRWTAGDSLGRMALDHAQTQMLNASVCVLLERGIGSLDKVGRKRWGAGMLLVGAQALGRLPEGPFSYERIGASIGFPGLDQAITETERNAMEQGAELWGIALMRISTQSGRLQRRFLGTMIRHSGAGWVLLEGLAELVARRWSWAGVDAATAETIAGWIQQCIERQLLGRKMARALESEETRHALAERLQDMAAVWAVLREAGVVDADQALKTIGLDELASLLDAPEGDEDAARRMLGFLCEAPSEEAGDEIRWRWFSGGHGHEGVVIELARRMHLPEVPDEVDRVRVQVLGVVSSQQALYMRQGDVFEYRQGQRLLRTPQACSEQVMVIAQYRSGHELVEIVAAELSMPAASVALFDTRSGRVVRRPYPGARIALVPPPGWSMRAPAGFTESGREPLRAWVGTMPPEAVECMLVEPEGEEVPWTLSPAVAHLDVLLMNAIDGLRLSGVPVVQGAPQLRVSTMRGRGTCTVRRHDGTVLVEGAVRSRGGRLQLPMDEWLPGKYRIELELGGQKRGVPVTVLPAATVIDIRSDANGTTAVLEGDDVQAHLRLRDAVPAQEGHCRLLIGPEIRGSVALDLTVRAGSRTWTGRWSLRASPQVVEVVDAQGMRLDGEDDLSLLRNRGALRIHGRPRTSVEVQIDDIRWSVRLSPEGERLFPFALIPNALLLRREALGVKILWPDGCERPLRFVNPLASRLTAWVWATEGQPEASRLRITWERPIAGDVHVEAVRAWQPWLPAISMPAVPATWDAQDGKSGRKTGYEAALSLPPGGYQIVLMSGERRVSGMTLVCSPDGQQTPPPDGLTALERELWSEPNIGRVAAILEGLAQSGEDEAIVPGVIRTLYRYGVRWFRIADAMANILGRWRLEVLAREENPSELDRQLKGYYEQMGLARMFVRERDLARMGERLAGMEAGSANALLRSVAELFAGLLLPAARHWQGWLSYDEPHMLDTIDLQRLCLKYERPRPLEHDERECLLETDVHAEDAEDALALAQLDKPRLRGLLELRQFRDRIWEDPVVANLALERGRLEDRWFLKLPERIGAIEQAVATIAWEVHRWRHGGHMTTRRMQEISRLERLAQHSFDYWLNAWGSLASGGEGEV